MTIRFKLPKNLDKQIVAQVILVVLFLLVCVWIAVQPNPFDVNEAPPPPQNGQIASQEAPPNPSQLAMKATAYQLEIEGNRDQTLGIVLGGIMLVLLVVGSTLMVMGKR